MFVVTFKASLFAVLVHFAVCQSVPSATTTATRVYGQLGSFTSSQASNGCTSAGSLFNPTCVAADSAGVYVADSSNNRVLYYVGTSTTPSRVYGQSGSFSTNIDRAVSANTLTSPSCVAVDSSGIYIADSGNNRVLYYPGSSTTASRVYGQSGSYTSNTINNGGISADSLNGPAGVAVDSAGGVYVSDSGNNRVLFYSGNSTTASRVFGQFGSFSSNTPNNGGVSLNSLKYPQGIAANISGLYVADTANNRVLFFSGTSTTASRVYNQTGNLSVTSGARAADFLFSPFGVSIGPNGLYIADSGNNRVLYFPGSSMAPSLVYGQAGSFASSDANKGGLSGSSLSGPVSVAPVANGVYMVDKWNSRVLFFPGTSASASRVYGQRDSLVSSTPNLGGSSADCLMNYIPRMAADATGVYVVDTVNSRVLYFAGTSTTASRVYGQRGSFTDNMPNNGGISADSLNLPRGVAISPNGIYIADTGNSRVLFYPGISTTASRVYGQLGNFSSFTTFSTGIFGGVNVTADSLSFPTAVAVDSTGIYISDSSNQRALFYPGTLTTASRVYGQLGSFTSTTIGFVSPDSLSSPSSIAVDGNGGVYISDCFGNARVLYFSGTSTTASRVYGQAGFYVNFPSSLVSASSLGSGPGSYQECDISVTFSGVYIADTSNNRVLYYPGISTTASVVYGQFGNFSTNSWNYPTSASSLASPRSVATDGGGGVYIADSNSRVLFFDSGIASSSTTSTTTTTMTTLIGTTSTPSTGTQRTNIVNQRVASLCTNITVVGWWSTAAACSAIDTCPQVPSYDISCDQIGTSPNVPWSIAYFADSSCLTSAAASLYVQGFGDSFSNPLCIAGPVLNAMNLYSVSKTGRYLSFHF